MLAELRLGYSSGLWSKDCSFCETARVRWYPAFVWWHFGNLSARSHGVLQQPERAEVKKGKKGDGWSTRMC